jgi:putative PIN family toxin of toxin-antitoxin system
VSRLGRLVLDNSTLVGTLLGPQSVPRRAFMLAVTHFDVCVSQATLDEAQKVFGRAKFDRYHTKDYRARFLAMYLQRALLIGVETVDEDAACNACRDPADAKILALANACAAEVLISSDQDLLVLDGWQGLSIQSPAAFVEAMERSGA